MLAQLRAGVTDRFRHLAENVDTAVVRLIERNPHDLLGYAADLDVHLQCGDALIGASHFEVHVAEMILIAKDVGEHGEALTFLDEAHGNAGDWMLQRHARIHERKRGSAHRRHRRRAVRFRDLGNDADRVRELLFLRQQRMNGSPGELTVAHFAAARRAHAARLAYRIGRKVVMQHEMLLVGAFQRIHVLLVLAGAER